LRALTGQALTQTLDLRTGAVQLSGGTGTYVLTPPDAVPLGAMPVAEDSPGVYFVNLPATSLAQSGLYQGAWTVTAGGNTYTTDSWFVLTPWMPGLTPRWELRHRVAQELHDGWLGDAQSATATTLVDTARWEPTGHWKGAEVYCYGGTGRGQARRVIASDPDTGTLTVSRAWDVLPTAGTLYELHKRFTIDEYNRTLERTLSRHRHTVLLPIETATLATTCTQHLYSVPPPYDTVRRVEWHGTDWSWDPSHWTLVEPGDWDLHSGRQLYLRCPRDATVRLLGEMAWDDLPDDDSITGGPVEWLVLRAAATLLSSRLTAQAADSQGWREHLTYLEKASSDIMPRSRPRPSSRRVRA
jgi:hypothetical protein